MPLEICKISREQRNKIGKESAHHSPEKGYCASQTKYFYGYKLHSVCSASGVIPSLDFEKVRKRIETVFSQLCYQFIIQRITPNPLPASNPGYWQN
jgi:hypothetical protein